MKTRYLADSLGLPPDWQAERYSTTIRLIGPTPYGGPAPTIDLVLPYSSTDLEIEDLKVRCAQAIADFRAGRKPSIS